MVRTFGHLFFSGIFHHSNKYPETRGTVRQLETNAVVYDRHTASSLVAYLLTACGASLTAGVCMVVERTTCDAFG
jgi:hypothetical protein